MKALRVFILVAIGLSSLGLTSPNRSPHNNGGGGGGGGSGTVTTVTSSDGFLEITDGTTTPDIILSPVLGGIAGATDNMFIASAGSIWNFSLSTVSLPALTSCAPNSTQTCFDTNGITGATSPMLVFDFVGTDYYAPMLSSVGTAGTKRAIGIGTGNATETTLVTATPTASAIPLADGSGTLDSGWIPALPEPVASCASGYVRSSDGVGGAACTPGATADHAVLTNRDDVSGHLWAVRKTTYAGDPNTGLACVADDVYRLRVWNTNATPDEEWVCIAAGTPGTFVRASAAGGHPFTIESSHPSWAQVNSARCMPLTATTSGEFWGDAADAGYRFRPIDTTVDFSLTSLTMHYFDNNGTSFDSGDEFYLDFVTCELVQADNVTISTDCTTRQRVRFEFNTVDDGDGDGVYDCADSQVCRRTVPLDITLPAGSADGHAWAVCFNPADAQFTLDDSDGGAASTDNSLTLLVKGFN